MGEWRRIFNRKMILLILGAIIVNVLLFGYGELSGLTFKEFTFSNSADSYFIERYHDMSSDIALDSLKKDNTAIIGYNRQIKDDNPQTYNESGGGYDRNAELQNIENPEIVNYFSSLTDKEKTQMLLEMKYTNVKLTYIAGYHNSIAAIQGNADKLKHFTLFSKPDSFSYNNILKTISSITAITKTILMRPETRLTLLGRLGAFLHKRYQKIFIHFPITFMEFHKLIITGKGLWVVGVVLLISIYFSSTGAMNFTDRQKEYDSMYLEHGGKDYSFITGYIDSEEQFYKG